MPKCPTPKESLGPAALAGASRGQIKIAWRQVFHGSVDVSGGKTATPNSAAPARALIRGRRGGRGMEVMMMMK